MRVFISFILISLFFITCEKDPALPAATLPELITIAPVINITYTSATAGGEITSAGGAVISARGICWSVSPMPTTSDSKTINTGGAGFFTENLINLLPGTTYYARAYATNGAGTSYGNQLNFITLKLPVVTTNNITSITVNSAISGGNVSNAGSSTVSARGICWSTSMNPVISLSTKTVNGAGTGSFSSNLTGLATMTTYYVRAYATNAGGTSYGANISFRSN